MSVDFQTCDLCDTYMGDDSGQLSVLAPVFQHYGARRKFAGPVVTIRCFEDNSHIRAALASPGHEQVLVIDGGASLRKALVGGTLAALAARQGWAGIVVNGCVRDVAELAVAQIGVAALASLPMPTEKRGQGERGVVIQVQGVRIAPGSWLYADADGILVAQRPLHASSLQSA